MAPCFPLNKAASVTLTLTAVHTAELVFTDGLATQRYVVSSVVSRANYKLAERLGEDPGTEPPVTMAILVGAGSWQLAPLCLPCPGSGVAVQ